MMSTACRGCVFKSSHLPVQSIQTSRRPLSSETAMVPVTFLTNVAKYDMSHQTGKENISFDALFQRVQST